MNFQKLSDREHLLRRPNMYIGATDLTQTESFLFEDNKISYREIEFVPGLVKIINEIIDNSVDEYLRSEISSKIKISVKNNRKIVVEDFGNGIPVIRHKKEKIYLPELAWGHSRAGVNFDTSDSIIAGMHGIGSFATNCFSESFIGETADGKNKMIIEYGNNGKLISKKIKKTTRKFTKVSFIPDYANFGFTELSKIHQNIIHQRLVDLSIAYPHIKFIFNGKQIKFPNPKKFLNLFGESFVSIQTEDYFIGVFPNETDDFRFYSNVNGLNLPVGGNHIQLLTSNIVKFLRDKLKRKFPSIKPGDIKNKLLMVVFFKKFPNCKFESQTKEKLTNSVHEVNRYLSAGEADWELFYKKILKNKELIEKITEIYAIKEALKKKQNLKSMKGKKKIKSEKYLAPTKNHKYLVICEGQSASGGLIGVLGRKDFGYYSLKGKILNVLNAKTSKISTNVEVKELIQILQIDALKKKIDDITYDSVLIACDQDFDGKAITSLLISFFYKFAPELLKTGRIKILQTPLIAIKQKGKIIEKFFSFPEYNRKKSSLPKNSECKYYKGLGSWEQEDLHQLFTGNLDEEYIIPLEWGQLDETCITGWMKSEQVSYRKDKIVKKPFSIEAA